MLRQKERRKNSGRRKIAEYIVFAPPGFGILHWRIMPWRHQKEELPRYYEVRDSYTYTYTCTDQLVNYLTKNTDIRLVYPKQDLLSAKRENPDILLYYKLDTY